MAKTKISKAAKDFNISIATLVEFLQKKGIEVENPENPNTRINETAYELLVKEYAPDRKLKNQSELISTQRAKVQEKPKETPKATDEVYRTKTASAGPKVIGRIDLSTGKPKPAEPVKEEQPAAPVQETKPEAPVKAAEEPKPETTPAPVKKEEKAAPAVAEESPKTPEAPAEVPEKKEKEKKQEAPEKTAPATPAAPAPKAEPKAEKPEEKSEPAKNNDETDNFIPTKVTGGLNINVVGKIDLSALNQTTRPKKKTKEEKRNERLAAAQANGNSQGGDRKKRRRIGGKEKIDIESTSKQPGGSNGQNNGGGRGERPQRERGRNRERERRPIHTEVNEEDVQKQVKETLARLTNKDKGQKKGAKWRKEKREANATREREAYEMEKAESKLLKLTEFVTVNDLASMMDVPVNSIIATCMSLGEMVSINQRLDAETINIVAEEFGFRTEYVSAEVAEAITQEEDSEEDLMDRPPIVTVMGHVDHGKTSLLDYIRNANVIAGEAGGITQHIGAYNVKLADGRHITFLDTPGHEAFTAMRARGAKVTDLCIIIVAADDNVMPQTKEAINHATAAGVPIVFAINKIDKPAANPDKIKEELASMNFLVEDWGGKYQSQDISAKKGIGVEELMEKVLLEAELLELKANSPQSYRLDHRIVA